MSHVIIDKDTRGRQVEVHSKTGKSVEVDGQSRFCGHRFLLQGKMFGDKRCLYCGKWFHWQQSNADKWIAEQNIDDTNVDNTLEPIHCGSGHCCDYHKKTLDVKKRREMEIEKETMALFKSLGKRGLI